MIDKETYKKELARYFDSIRKDGYEDDATDFADCIGVECTNCMFHDKYTNCPESRAYDVFEKLAKSYDIFEKLEEWSKKNPPKHKISKSEYDVLDNYLYYNDEKEINFGNSYALSKLIERGYFKSETNETNIHKHLDNCAVVEDNG